MSINYRRLLKEDLDKPCQDLALYLLGKVLVRKLDHNTILKGRIVETECYLGGDYIYKMMKKQRSYLLHIFLCLR